jgi:hypothetical protein
MSKIIVNVESGEVIERELNEQELAQQVEDEKTIEQRKEEEAIFAENRKNLLGKLGITEEEARLLLG